jgi:uncharacterized protein (TIGR02466 family)
MKINLFPTPIYQLQLADDNLDKVQQELTVAYNDHVVNNLFKDPFNDNRMQTSNGTFSEDIFNKYRPMTFLNIISESLRDYVSDFVQQEYEAIISNAWMTRMRKSEYCHIHSHSGCGGTHISGVYYYKADPTDGCLFFETPLSAGPYTPIGNNSAVRIEPQVGQLVLFPSWLQHGVTTQNYDRDRISVSFNIGIRFKE